jgi:nucleoside-diphosphate-sugar epimerase
VKVLATGAGGVLGREVVAHLAANGHAVRAHDRVALPPQAAAFASEYVAGDLREAGALEDALTGIDAVVHAAAYPSPNAASEADVFANNVEASYHVLGAAGLAGIGRVVNISSLSAVGLAWSQHDSSPLRVPLTEEHPYIGDDVYGLSKYVGEQIAATASRRWRMPVVSLRFPFLGTGQRLRAHLSFVHADPGRDRGSLWAWLDSRDAARAVEAALTCELSGHVLLNIAAPDTTSWAPTGELLRRYHPGARIDAPLDGFATPISTRRSAEVLGFTPIHAWRTPEASDDGH